MECVKCVYVWLGVVSGLEDWVGLYQPCGNRRRVGCVSVFDLRWCRWEVGRGLGPVSGSVGWCYGRVSCESGLLL